MWERWRGLAPTGAGVRLRIDFSTLPGMRAVSHAGGFTGHAEWGSVPEEQPRAA